ncbi:MAG: DoxX family protein [Ectothiorhodospiraceae bacterium]
MTNENNDRTPDRIIPALGTIYDGLSPYAYPLIRFIAGAALIPHGWQKLVQGGVGGTAQFMASVGIEPAMFFAWYIGCLELFGGTLLAVGLLTRVWAIQVVGFMAVAAIHVHSNFGYYWTDKGFEYPMFWGVVAFAILIRGGGRLSLDRLIGKEI